MIKFELVISQWNYELLANELQLMVVILNWKYRSFAKFIQFWVCGLHWKYERYKLKNLANRQMVQLAEIEFSSVDYSVELTNISQIP